LSVQQVRDNLNIGLALAENHPWGCPLDQLLTETLGYTPGAAWPIGNRDHYISRLREAQSIGEQKYAAREPGYFTINAHPLGRIFVYKAVWYTWVNPANGHRCTVPVCSTDLAAMRRWREEYMATRTRSTRSIKAADNIIRKEDAIGRNDTQAVRSIDSEMAVDGTLAEIVTGLLGVPYVDAATMLELLSDGHPYGPIQYRFTQQARRIRDLERRLADEQINIANQLTNFVRVRQNLPRNVVQIVLQDARDRLARLQ